MLVRGLITLFQPSTTKTLSKTHETKDLLRAGKQMSLKEPYTIECNRAQQSSVNRILGIQVVTAKEQRNVPAPFFPPMISSRQRFAFHDIFPFIFKLHDGIISTSMVLYLG
jgi:hypothetical protein